MLSAELDGLRRAMASRAVIEQAKGMLVERHRCTPDEAFEVLVAKSQRTDRKLREIAAEQVLASSPHVLARGDHHVDVTRR